VLVGTPIGNLGDLSPRAAQALKDADVVAAEDTRRSRVLLDHVGARVPLVSYHEHNEERRTAVLLERVAAGQTVAVITDAGTPGIADPGFRLVRAAADQGLRVEAIPGPAAAIQALVLSGLPTDRFAFEGFLPRRPGPRARRLRDLAADPRTLVFYVAPHRAAEELAAMAQAFGGRPAALARELTKLHEEVWRARLPELAERAAAGLRGEITLVVAGAVEPATREPGADDLPPAAGDLAARVHALLAMGSTRKDAIARVARAAGVPKRIVYAAVVHHDDRS
jgi:16S rRNA (cytidine1402-2'-O)-methyltransferase